MTTIFQSGRLTWRQHSDRLSLHLDGRGRALIYVVADTIYPGMFRVRHLDGTPSDMASLTRAKDAGRHQAMAVLNRQTEHKETGVEAYVVAPNRSSATPLAEAA